MIKELFEAYEKQVSRTPNVNEIFSQSGMVNRRKELEYGFFPLGSGILTEKSKIEEAEIGERGTMVLGHDFGTVSYVNNKCENKREKESNKTIRNLKTIEYSSQSIAGGRLHSFFKDSFFLLSSLFSFASFDGLVGLRFLGFMRLLATSSSSFFWAICLFSN